MSDKINPIRPTDNDARALAHSLVTGARFAALGVIEPDTKAPMVTRVACGWFDAPHLLVSDLSQHRRALQDNPTCSLMLASDDIKGDPLTHPRITLQCTAVAADKSALRDNWLGHHPKSKLYFDFADFRMLRLDINMAHLNGGFGKAFQLSASDFK